MINNLTTLFITEDIVIKQVDISELALFDQCLFQIIPLFETDDDHDLRTHENRELIREQEGLAPIIRLIASTSPGLLVNVAAAIGQMAEDVESLEQVGVVQTNVDKKLLT